MIRILLVALSAAALAGCASVPEQPATDQRIIDAGVCHGENPADRAAYEACMAAKGHR